jgi:hypothetical protein
VRVMPARCLEALRCSHHGVKKRLSTRWGLHADSGQSSPILAESITRTLRPIPLPARAHQRIAAVLDQTYQRPSRGSVVQFGQKSIQ